MFEFRNFKRQFVVHFETSGSAGLAGADVARNTADGHALIVGWLASVAWEPRHRLKNTVPGGTKIFKRVTRPGI
jgi:hypothetical protein